MMCAGSHSADAGASDQVAQVGRQVHHGHPWGLPREGNRLGGDVHVGGLEKGGPDGQHVGMGVYEVRAAATHPGGKPQLKGQVRLRALRQAECGQPPEHGGHEWEIDGGYGHESSVPRGCIKVWDRY
jgi:hypothetical protein